MSSPTSPDEKRYQRIRSSVCILAAVVAAFMGVLASLFYDRSQMSPIGFVRAFGIGWGGLTGLAAAIFWCRIMRRRAIRCGTRFLMSIGIVAGVFAGVLSTTLLHAGLMVASQKTNLEALALGVIAGVLIGLLMGAIYGYIFRRAVDSSEVHAFPVSEGGAP